MILNHHNFIAKYQDLQIAPDKILAFPERVLQFGTGVLLRGLPDYYIDKANKEGHFQGRVVVVKTTGSSAGSEFANQDNLYTHIIKGVANGQLVEEEIINASISRVLHATADWQEVLACARRPEIDILISNTTEQGLVFTQEDFNDETPKSFPGKLLVYLIERYQAIGQQPESALMVIPTELIEHNGDLLKGILAKHMAYHPCPDGFATWLENHIVFCNSLVDRIVPGKPDTAILEAYWTDLAYQDDLLIESEPYNLWAIEGPAGIEEKLGFAQGNEGIKLTDDITVYKELKLRLLNACHTFSAGVALLSSLETVTESMQDAGFEDFITKLTADIRASIAFPIDDQVKIKFAADVLDRFRNPNIRHYWKSIVFSFTEKFKIRCMPLMKEYYKRHGSFPERMVQGLAAYFAVSIPAYQADGSYYSEPGNLKIKLNDPYSEKLYTAKLAGGDIDLIHKYIADYFLENEEELMVTDLQNLCAEFYQQTNKA